MNVPPSPYVIPGLIYKEPVTPSIAAVIAHICERYRLSENEVTGHSRTRKPTMARQEGMYLARLKVPHVTLKAIGAAFNRDHTTVMHSCRTVRNLMDTDPDYKRQVNDILKTIFFKPDL